MFRHIIRRAFQSAARVPGARALVYGAEALRYAFLYRETPKFARLVPEYREWRQSQLGRHQPLLDRVPWLTFAATHFLKSRLRPEMRVFEYGSGGSTLFFALQARSVVSVEHDAAWSAQVRQATKALDLGNCRILDVPPDDWAGSRPNPADPDAYVSSDPHFANMSFRSYAGAIDSFPDASFHIVLIDGRARPSCFKHAVNKLAPGGILILDNSERIEYAYIGRTLDDLGWQRHDFVGPGPLNQYFWKTTVWDRPT